MTKLVECIPNFSEGRRPEVVDQIIVAIKSVLGVKLLDYSSDESHNRSVVTFVGEPAVVQEAAFQGAKKAAELINMAEHYGEHPRMGATDVIPFIPITGVTMTECVVMAQALGERLALELSIPIYLYEAAASKPERANLAQVRKGEYEGIKEKIKLPGNEPDFGPAEVHPQAGVTAVGARPPLIAYNINLNTDKVEIAKKIAKAIRGGSGGYKHVKALGIYIKERNQAQVTINMCNFEETPLFRVFETVKSEANRYGVEIVGSEIVGLSPIKALIDVADFYLRLENFSLDQILEESIKNN